MRLRQKRSMRNTSAFSLLVFLGIFFLNHADLCASNSLEDIGKAVVSKYEETSKPLFQDQPEVKEKLKGDPFFDKIREKQQKFTREEQLKRRHFIEKIREKDWSGEKKQEALSQFQKKELARRKKFIDKQQEKIQKHQEEGTANG